MNTWWAFPWNLAAAVSAALYLLAAPNVIHATASQATEAYSQAEQATCGLRATYLFGRSSGLQWRYEEMDELLPRTEQGVSLAAMRDVLRQRGIDCAVRRLSPTDLQAASLPMIVLLRTAFSPTGRSHFLIVTEVTARGVTAIDPTIGETDFWGWRAFSDAWSGHGLLHTSAPGRSSIWLAAFLVLNVSGCGYLCAKRLLGNTAAPRNEVRGEPAASDVQPALRQHTATVALGLVAAVLLQPATAAAGEQLRAPRRDGPNGAILLAALSGVVAPADMNASSMSQVADAQSLAEIQRSAERLGCPTVIRALDYPTLAALDRPVLVLLRDELQGAGQCAVVIRARPGVVTLIRAGTVVVQEVSEDRFRFRWTGHALIPVTQTNRTLLGVLAGCGALLAVAVQRHLAPRIQFSSFLKKGK